MVHEDFFFYKLPSVSLFYINPADALLIKWVILCSKIFFLNLKVGF